MRSGAELEEAIMLKLIALLGVIAALTLANPSNSVAQGWDGGGGGVTVSIGNLLGFHVGFPFPNRRPDLEERRERRFFPTRVDCCEERRFFPRQDFCCEERRFFPRQDFCCEERRFFPRQDFCCEERRFFPRQDFCCEESRFFPRREFEERRFFPRREFEESRFFPRREFEESRFFPRPFSRPPYYYGDYPAYSGGPRPYEYQARPTYDYNAAPRPPADIPGGYYNAAYVQ
jgi:hypothetical protein